MPLVASIVRLIFPIVSLFPREKTNLKKESILTKHSGLGSKMTPSCKWPIMERLSLRAGCSVDMARGLNIGLSD